jgi:hypothetical protein
MERKSRRVRFRTMELEIVTALKRYIVKPLNR